MNLILAVVILLAATLFYTLFIRAKDILIVPPGIAGVLGPYVVLSLGLLLVVWTIRRYMRPRKAALNGPPIDAATLARIEKDTANLD